jgi:Leucine-rich repeat (LRR) protein
MSKNKFNNFEASLPLMPNLDYLNIGRCCKDSSSFSMSPFPRDPSFFTKMPRLVRLHLYDNKITRIREEIGTLKKLVYLDVSKNLLTDSGLPKSIGNLSISELVLSTNKLRRYPESLRGTQTKLGRLELTDQPEMVASLPSWFWEAPALKNLVLSGNSLSTVPVGLKKLRALEQIRLEGNNLTVIPSWLSRQTFSNLKWVSVFDVAGQNFLVDNPHLPQSCFFGYDGSYAPRIKQTKRRCTMTECLVSASQVEQLCTKGEYLTDCTEPCEYLKDGNDQLKYCVSIGA